MPVVRKFGKVFTFPEGTTPEEIGNSLVEWQQQATAKDLPAIGSAPELNRFSLDAITTSAGLLFTGDEVEAGNIVANQIEGAQTRVDANGKVLIDLPSGSYAINPEGLDPTDVAKFFAQFGAFTPSALAARGGATLAAKAGIGLATGAGTQAVIETGQAGLGGEFDTGEVALAGAFGAGGELASAGIGKIAGKLMEGRRARQADIAGVGTEAVERQAGKIQEAKQISEEIAEEFGEDVGFLRAQQTMDPFQIEEQNFLGGLSETSVEAMNTLGKQNEQVARVVNRFLDGISNPESVSTAAKQLRGRADDVITGLQASRERATAPVFNQAFNNITPVNTRPALDYIDRELMRFPSGHPANKVLLTIKNNILESGNFLEKLHSVKEISDSKIGELVLKTTGKDAKSALNKAKAVATVANKTLRKSMRRHEPVYGEALDRYRELTKPITEAQEGLIGRLADRDDIALKDLSSSIFNPRQGTTNPQVINAAKESIESVPGGKDAWNAVLRSEFELRLGRVGATLDEIAAEGTKVKNAPGQIQVAFGNTSQIKALKAGMTPEQAVNFDLVTAMLKRATAGRERGSQTAFREEIAKKFSRTGLFRAVFSPAQSAAELGEESLRSNRIRAIGKIVFDPKWSADMQRIRKLTERQREDALIELINQVAGTLPLVTQPTRESL